MKRDLTLKRYLDLRPLPGQEKWSYLLDISNKSEYIKSGVGRLLARQALAIFSIRHDSLKRAGKVAIGLEDALVGLRATPPDEQVLLYHFESKSDLVTLFVGRRLSRLIGFVSLPLRFRLGPSGEDISGFKADGSC